MGRASLLVPALLGALAGPVVAQERTGKIELRAGAELGVVRTDVSSESSTDVGPLVTGQIGFAVTPGVDLTVDVVWQPFEAENPLGFEQYTAVSVLGGAQLGLGGSKRTFVRPAVGAAFSSWSGEDPWVESNTNVAFGLWAGYEFPLRAKLGLVPEAGVLIWGGDELTSVTFSIGASIVPVGARRRE